MPESLSQSESLQTRYEAKVASDLRQIDEDHQRVTAQIADLTEHLATLERDREMLRTLQAAISVDSGELPAIEDQEATVEVPVSAEAVDTSGAAEAVNGSVAAPAAPESEAKPEQEPTPAAAAKAVPKQRARSTRKKAAAKTAAKTAAKKETKASSKAGAKAAKKEASLVERVAGYLARQSEPKSAAEVAEAVSTKQQPISASQARVALEGLVRKAEAERSRQGSSVYYDATGKAGAGASDAAPEASGTAEATTETAGATEATEAPAAADASETEKEAQPESAAPVGGPLSSEQILVALKELGGAQSVRAIAEHVRGEGVDNAVANRVRTIMTRLVGKDLATKKTVDGAVVFEAAGA